MRTPGLIALALLCGCATTTSEEPPTVAVTVDDIPVHGDMLEGASRVEVGRAIVRALVDAQVPAAGFINGAPIEKDPATEGVLTDWAAAGLQLGNHSWSHASVDDTAVEAYRAEIERNEPLLQLHSRAGDWRWFRYPYLHEGKDDMKRIGVRALLAERSYRIAAVTMNFDDWAFNDAWLRCARRGDSREMAKLETDFLAAGREAARQSRRMARRLYRRDIPYILLMHLGAIQARLFPRLLADYRAAGFRFVPLADAQRDPVYAQENDPRLAPGPAGLEAQMEARGFKVREPALTQAELAAICA
jgi:peptidoglycan/xylan/chitin deacetylase (PgdA/CDA1 family)